MKELPLERVWTGDGRGQSDAVTHTQIKRTADVALYSVTTKTGTVIGYELFIIKKRFKGQPLPGDLFETEDREVYPSSGPFGKTAWNIASLERALKRFDELVAQGVTDAAEEDETETSFTVPVIEFTCGDLAEANSVTYAEAQSFIKENLDKTIKLARTGRKEGQTRGKPSNFYVKI